MATIFSRIIAREIPCYKITEDEHFIAFLDINPLSKGHTLVVPKIEEDYIFDLDDTTIAGMMIFAKIVALALGKTIDCKRIGVTVIGLEVPHAHIHLIPIKEENDMNLQRPKLKLSADELNEIAVAVSANIVI